MSKNNIKIKKSSKNLCPECFNNNLLFTGLSIYCENCGYDNFQDLEE